MGVCDRIASQRVGGCRAVLLFSCWHRQGGLQWPAVRPPGSDRRRRRRGWPWRRRAHVPLGVGSLFQTGVGPIGHHVVGPIPVRFVARGARLAAPVRSARSGGPRGCFLLLLFLGCCDCCAVVSSTDGAHGTGCPTRGACSGGGGRVPGGAAQLERRGNPSPRGAAAHVRPGGGGG